MKRWIGMGFLMLGAVSPLWAALPSGVVREAVESAARLSGRTLTPAAREAAELALRKEAAHAGEPVLELVRRGGLETLEQGARHGDDFWKTALAHPGAIRSLALHGDQLLPLARRIGPEVLELEARFPGVAARTAQCFGDAAVKQLARAPGDDVVRLLGLADKADSPGTRQLLWACYRKSGDAAGAFLARFNWKQIMAGGLSAAAVTAAYKVSDGVQQGLVTTAKDSPETFAGVVNDLARPVRYGIYALLAILLWPLARLAWRLGKKRRGRDGGSDQGATK